LGLLLLGVILLDSVNMLPSAGKGTARDEDAMQMLTKNTNWTSLETVVPSFVDATTLNRIFPNGRNAMPDRMALFEVLSSAKNDPQFWTELSVMDCLRIDYKKFIVSPPLGKTVSALSVSSIGLSSILVDMDSLLAKDNFQKDLAAFVASSDVDLFGVLALKFHDGIPRRELLLTGSNVDIVDSFSKHLLNHPDAAFLEVTEQKKCSTVEMDDSIRVKYIRVFRQGNSKGSRKQVAPILLGHAASI
jgi:exopolyphosphatase